MERNQKIIFRVTDQEKEIIQRNADARGMSVAEYLRDVTGQAERLKRLDERLDALSDTIDENSKTLNEHRKTDRKSVV